MSGDCTSSAFARDGMDWLCLLGAELVVRARSAEMVREGWRFHSMELESALVLPTAERFHPRESTGRALAVLSKPAQEQG